MLSVLWLYLLISAVVVFITYALFVRKGRLQDSIPAEKKIKYLKKHVPPSTSTGWQLDTVDSGLRVWKKSIGNSSPSWVPGTIFACSGIIPASQQEVITVLKQPGLLRDWDPRVKAVSKVTMATNHDDISVSFNCCSIIARVLHQIRGSFGGDINAIYSRHWEMDAKPNLEAWFISSFIGRVIQTEGTLWSCFLLSSIDNGDDEQTESLVTLIVAPVSSLFASIPRLTASRVAGLQDFFTHYKSDTSPTKSFESEASATTLMSSTSDDRAAKDPLTLPPVVSSPAKSCESEVTCAVATLMSSTSDEPANLVDDKIASSSLQKLGSTVDESHLPDFLRRQSIENLLQKLTAVYEGTEGTDGWVTVGNNKGVDILKRPASAGERPWDCLKGTSLVCAPIHYILAYIYSLDYRGEWDDLFLKGEVVEEYDPITKVLRMEYKPVWPASGRDFCTSLILREVAEGVICLASEAVEHEECPEQKGLVRAEIVIAGFVVKELSSDPPSCLVTYITRADLKGNLPVRLVNRVSASQPQAVAVLRDKLEALYQADVASNSQEMSKIQKEGADLWTALMKDKEAQLPRVEEAAACEKPESTWSLEEKHLEPDSSQSLTISDSGSKLEASNFKDSADMFPITEENMQLPFVDRHNIDFRTLGSQAVANLLGEILLANQLENSSSSKETSLSELMSTGQEWSYQSTEKDVDIYRKISPGEKIHGFLGKGMIKVKPPAVWEALRNHTTRHVFDKMLKKSQLVRQIDDQSKIIYLHHEAKQCILKQSRDFVLLETERVEPEKYIIAGVSVQVPELPPSPDIIRGKVYNCGWIIEPVLLNGQLYSMVSYFVQVDFGGVFPVMLLNLVARRQPLCIAYLRKYLEKSQN